MLRIMAALRLPVLGLVLLAAACGSEPAALRAKNAILITIDTASARSFGCYGGPPDLTPSVDRLAQEGLRFAQARTVAPLTLPAHASLLTGLYPPRHRLRDNGLRALPASAQTLAEACRDAGFSTAAFVSAAVLDAAFGLDQGFDVYSGPPRPAQQTTSHYAQRNAAETAQETRWWLNARERGRPFFLWVHFYDPHVPYDPPPAFLDRAGGDPHLGEIAFVDQAIGELLEPLRQDGTLDETLLVLTSDHGESLGAHGEPTHGAFCYDATLHVPLVLRLPGRARAGEVVEEVVTLSDVHPTLLAALGLAPDAAVDGRALLAPPAAREGIYFESYSGYLNYGWSPLAGWLDARGKYLHSSRPEHYDWRADPGEARDLAAEADTAGYRTALAELLARPPLADDTPDGRISDALLSELRQLGYGAIGALLEELPSPLEPSDRPSPKERACELEPLLVANALGDARRYADAVPILQAIVAENPNHLLALDLLAFGLMQLEHFDEARAILERRVSAGAQRADTCINLAVCLERAGDTERARGWYERALELDPSNAQALEELARLAAAAGDAEAASRWRARLESLHTGG
jgi:arylsulfatase A-like enzyme